MTCMPTNWCTWQQSLLCMDICQPLCFAPPATSPLQRIALFHVLPYQCPVYHPCSSYLQSDTCGANKQTQDQCTRWKPEYITPSFYILVEDFCWKFEWQRKLQGYICSHWNLFMRIIGFLKCREIYNIVQLLFFLLIWEWWLITGDKRTHHATVVWHRGMTTKNSATNANPQKDMCPAPTDFGIRLSQTTQSRHFPFAYF